jgi:hypothetical protein
MNDFQYDTTPVSFDNFSALAATSSYLVDKVSPPDMSAYLKPQPYTPAPSWNGFIRQSPRIKGSQPYGIIATGYQQLTRPERLLDGNKHPTVFA